MASPLASRVAPRRFSAATLLGALESGRRQQALLLSRPTSSRPRAGCRASCTPPAQPSAEMPRVPDAPAGAALLRRATLLAAPRCQSIPMEVTARRATAPRQIKPFCRSALARRRFLGAEGDAVSVRPSVAPTDPTPMTASLMTSLPSLLDRAVSLYAQHRASCAGPRSIGGLGRSGLTLRSAPRKLRVYVRRRASCNILQ